eukprot:377642_1
MVHSMSMYISLTCPPSKSLTIQNLILMHCQPPFLSIVTPVLCFSPLSIVPRELLALYFVSHYTKSISHTAFLCPVNTRVVLPSYSQYYPPTSTTLVCQQRRFICK